MKSLTATSIDTPDKIGWKNAITTNNGKLLTKIGMNYGSDEGLQLQGLK